MPKAHAGALAPIWRERISPSGRAAVNGRHYDLLAVAALHAAAALHATAAFPRLWHVHTRLLLRHCNPQGGPGSSSSTRGEQFCLGCMHALRSHAAGRRDSRPACGGDVERTTFLRLPRLVGALRPAAVLAGRRPRAACQTTDRAEGQGRGEIQFRNFLQHENNIYIKSPSNKARERRCILASGSRRQGKSQQSSKRGWQMR